jgi:hypothetical protein
MAAGIAKIHRSREFVVQAANPSIQRFDLNVVAASQVSKHRTFNAVCIARLEFVYLNIRAKEQRVDWFAFKCLFCVRSSGVGKPDPAQPFQHQWVKSPAE